MKRNTKALGALLVIGVAIAVSAPAAAGGTGNETFKGVIVTSGSSGERLAVSSVIVGHGVFNGVGRVVEIANLPTEPLAAGGDVRGRHRTVRRCGRQLHRNGDSSRACGTEPRRQLLRRAGGVSRGGPACLERLAVVLSSSVASFFPNTEAREPSDLYAPPHGSRART